MRSVWFVFHFVSDFITPPYGRNGLLDPFPRPWTRLMATLRYRPGRGEEISVPGTVCTRDCLYHGLSIRQPKCDDTVEEHLSQEDTPRKYNNTRWHLFQQQHSQIVQPSGVLGMVLAEVGLCDLHRTTEERLGSLIFALRSRRAGNAPIETP